MSKLEACQPLETFEHEGQVVGYTFAVKVNNKEFDFSVVTEGYLNYIRVLNKEIDPELSFSEKLFPYEKMGINKYPINTPEVCERLRQLLVEQPQQIMPFLTPLESSQ